MMPNRRILMISPSFPPIADSESFCGGKMALALMNAGCEVETIYCSNYRGGVRLDDSQQWKELSQCSHDVPAPLSGNNRFEAAACAFRFQTLSFARWIRDVIQRAEELHRNSPFDAVYSRSLPMIAHVAGYHVSQHLHLPWVANLNDPWDFHLFPDAMAGTMGFKERSVSNYWLRKTLGTADLVTYCSERLRNYHDAIAQTKNNSAVIPHIGWQSTSETSPEHGLHLVHAGKLGTNEFTGRSTEALLRGVAEFVQKHTEEQFNFSLTLVGPEDLVTTAMVHELGLGKYVHSIGTVNYEQSLRWIASASVCVLVEAKMREGIFFPSKFADYTAAGKPILAFSPDHGVVADFGAQFGGIIRINGSHARRVSSVLDTYYAAQHRGSLYKFAAKESFRSLCSPEQVACEFLRRLDEIGALTKTNEPTIEKGNVQLPVWGKSFVPSGADAMRKR